MSKPLDPKQVGDALTDDTIALIAECLNKGDRVELIPLKDGIKLMQVKREAL